MVKQPTASHFFRDEGWREKGIQGWALVPALSGPVVMSGRVGVPQRSTDPSDSSLIGLL